MRSFARFSLVTAATAMVALAPAISQTVGDNALQEASLNIPGGQFLYKRNDPNVRRATAVVNGEIITGTDIDQRIMLLTNGDISQVPKEQLDQLRIEILGQLVDELLRIQEAEANELEIADGELNDYISRVAQQNFKRSVPETEKHLAQIGSSIGSLRKQVKAELAWNRVLGRNVTPFINVSDDEVNARLEKVVPISGRSNTGWAKSISRRTTRIASRFTKPRANIWSNSVRVHHSPTWRGSFLKRQRLRRAAILVL